MKTSNSIKHSLMTLGSVFLFTSVLSAQDFIKAPNGTFWKIDAGLKRMFTSSESIVGYGFDQNKAVEVDQEKFDIIPTGDPLPSRKKIVKNFTVDAQDRSGVEILVEGWTIVEGPTASGGSDVEKKYRKNDDGKIVSVYVSSHNPNWTWGRSRRVTVTVILEKD